MSAATSATPRFARLARLLEVATVVGIVLIIALAATSAYIPGRTRNVVLAKLGQAGASLPITPPGQALAGIVMAVPIAVMLYGLFAVRRMFAEFARGEIFTDRAARHLQIFAATILAQAPLGPLTNAGLSAALSLGNPPDQRALIIAFSLNDYLALIVGGVLLATATVMREAARLAEDNASIV